MVSACQHGTTTGLVSSMFFKVCRGSQTVCRDIHILTLSMLRTVDWSGLTVPGGCLEGGFHSRILLRGIGPLVLLALISVIGWVTHEVHRFLDRARVDPSPLPAQGHPWLRSLLNTLPPVLFFAFVLVTPTSSNIFAAWTCETFASNSIADPPETTAFLITDLSLKCDSSDADYSRVETLSYIFVGLWPIGIPLLFLLMLLRCRVAIMQGRMTRLVRSTSFLHREYKKHYL
jgi:hypothetical protein